MSVRIICYYHCNVKLFCFNLSNECPLCKFKLNDSDMEFLPIEIPNPFINALKAPYSLVIRPTNGDFLNDYRNSSDLHIGITDSNGIVYEFDKDGLHIGTRASAWSHCLQIPLAHKTKDDKDDISKYWDSKLKILVDSFDWSAQNYRENYYNCYSFVLKFVSLLKIENLPLSLSKTKFCEDYIVPRTKIAAKYITLYRKIIKNGFVIVK